MNPFSDFNKNVLKRSFESKDPTPSCSSEDNKKRELRRKLEDIKAQDELEKQCDTMSYLDEI